MKILFVSNGDVCRSPMAKGILRHKLKEKNITSVEVDSAGFESHLIGEPPDPNSIKICAENNIDISDYRSSLFSTVDFNKYDKIYVMDHKNYRNVKFFAENEKDMEKVDFLMNLLKPGLNKHLVDPYHKKVEGFKKTFNKIDKACDKIIEYL